MASTDSKPLPRALDDVFYCRARRRRLTLEKCLDDYVTANAFTRRSMACYRCPQGRGNREAFATSGPIPAGAPTPAGR